MPSRRAAICLWFAPSFLYGQTCPDRALDFFEKEKYQTGKVIVSGFRLLRISAESLGGLSELEGKPYNDAVRIAAQTRLRQALIQAPPMFDSPVGGTVLVPRPVNCREV